MLVICWHSSNSRRLASEPGILGNPMQFLAFYKIRSELPYIIECLVIELLPQFVWGRFALVLDFESAMWLAMAIFWGPWYYLTSTRITQADINATSAWLAS